MLNKTESVKSDLINPISSRFFNYVSIPVSSGYYDGTFKVEITGDEDKWVEDVKFNGREVVIITKEKTEDRTYTECLEWEMIKDKETNETAESCSKEETKTYDVPLTMPVNKITSSLTKEKLTDISKETKDSKESFTYIIPEDVHYLKIGENSITITESQIATQSNLNNVTAETGKSNHTHLTISTTAPYNSLVAYWSFDGDKENTKLTTHYDWSNNNYDGTGVGDVSANTTCGIIGEGACFDGMNDDYVSIANPGNILDGKNLTVSAWVYQTSLGTASRVVDRTYNSQFATYISSTGNMGGSIDGATADSDGVFTGCDTTLNEWMYLTWIYNSVGMYGYINGVYCGGSIVAEGALDVSTSAIRIGQRVDGTLNRGWNGSIDEVMIFNIALNNAQILAIYNNQSARFLPTGTQSITNQSYMNISTGNNRVNVTTYTESLFGSSINLSVGYYNVTGWFSTAQQIVSSGVVKTFNISGVSTNLTFNYTFYAGNSTNPFYSSIIKNNITYEIWNEGEEADSIYPIFTVYYDDNASLQGSGTGHFNVTVANTNGTVILHINGTNIYATNRSADNYNVSFVFTHGGNYMYNWTAYGNGTSHNINISNNFWYTVNTTGVSNTCSYTSSNWVVNCADYCNITTNVNGGGTGNNFTAIGVGWFKMSANISGFKNYKFGGGCNATCTSTGCIRI